MKLSSVQKSDRVRKAASGCFAHFYVLPLYGSRNEAMTMNCTSLLELLADGPVIAAVKDDAGLEPALESDVAVLFLLYGDILTIGEKVARIHQADKKAFVHLDLIDGLSAREISADFIARYTAADGVISTKAALTKRARELGLVAIQRVFLLDSMALKNVERHFSQESADLVEVLPGLMPKIIRQLCQTTGKPIMPAV